MAFNAKYEGQCANCLTAIQVGQSIEYDADNDLVHATPGECVVRVEMARKPEVCTTCWLTKPCGCDDPT